MTAAQYKAYLHYLQTHRALDARLKRAAAAAAAKGRGAVMPKYVGKSYRRDCNWILGENDVLETCSLTAIANSLLLEGMGRAEDEEITAAGEGLSLTEALAYVDDFGLGGHELKVWSRCPRGMERNRGNVIGLDTPWGKHAVLALGRNKVVSWGRVMDIGTVQADEAWALGWR